MIEIFRNTNYDFLGKKWLCIGFSCVLLLLGVASILWRAADGNPNSHPFNLGVDFTGGTIVNAKFNQKPDPGVIRAAIEKQGIDGSKVTIQAGNRGRRRAAPALIWGKRRFVRRFAHSTTRPSP